MSDTPTQTVNSDDFNVLLICTVRYAMGRMSFIVGQTSGFVKNYWPTLTASTKEVIIRDVNDELDKVLRNNGFLGAKMDHDVWVNLLNWMQANA